MEVSASNTVEALATRGAIATSEQLIDLPNSERSSLNTDSASVGNVANSLQDVTAYDSLEEALSALRLHEMQTTTKFCVVTKTKDFGKKVTDTKHSTFHWETEQNAGCPISFDGTPFLLVGKKILECQHGMDRERARKEKRAANTDNTEHFTKKRRFLVQNSKKLNCPATVIIRQIIKFPDCKIKNNTLHHRKRAVLQLRHRLQSAPRQELFYISLPQRNDHKFHHTGQVSGLFQGVDRRIIDKIHQYVTDGVKQVDEMQRHLSHYVTREMFADGDVPERTNRRYFPKKQDIRNHMYRATVKHRFSKIDQENLTKKLEEWKVEFHDDCFFFRPYASGEECEDSSEAMCDADYGDGVEDRQNRLNKQKLLFVHQTKQQKYLLSTYGNEITLLDATYKTTRYALPLFFLAVRTNVNYQVVGSFVTQDEMVSSITEALHVISSWNTTWQPSYFMTDFCEEEINAIETTFPNCTVLLCDFHREQAWERWVARSDNGVTTLRENVLAMLRGVAHAATPECYTSAVEELKNSDIWKQNKRLRDWFSQKWMPQHKRWVWAYRKNRITVTVRTNNGLERQNEALKHQYLKQYRDKTLSGMLTVLVEQFLPDSYMREMYNRYIEQNVTRSDRFRVYNQQVPAYLHNKPLAVVKHILERLTAADTISMSSITEIGQGEFQVKSASSKEVYKVIYGDEHTLPSCSCIDWQRNWLPCKHFARLFKAGWDWNQLSSLYTNSPYLQLDLEIMQLGAMVNNAGAASEASCLPVEKLMMEELPKPEKTHRTRAARCRELMREMSSLTYRVTDQTVLKDVSADLQRLLKTLQQAAPNEAGIHLEGVHRKGTLTIAKSSKERLPVGRRHRHPAAGRVGKAAATLRKTYAKLKVGKK